MLTGILIGGAAVISAMGLVRGIRRVRGYVTAIVTAATSR